MILEYIYTYIYLLISYLPAFTVPEKKKRKKKKPPGTRDKSISNHRPEEKEKIIGQKERKGQPRRTPWKKSRDTPSVGQKKAKNFRESCNATVTRVLNTSGANYKINIYIYPSTREGCETTSTFKWNLTGLNSESSFSWTVCLIKDKESSLSYLPIAELITFQVYVNWIYTFPKVC